MILTKVWKLKNLYVRTRDNLTEIPRGFLSPFCQILEYNLDYAMTTSFHIIPASSFTSHPIIRHYIIWMLIASSNNPQS
jgi:hypothetical protein